MGVIYYINRGSGKVKDQARIKLVTPGSAGGLVTDCATGPSVYVVYIKTSS